MAKPQLYLFSDATMPKHEQKMAMQLLESNELLRRYIRGKMQVLVTALLDEPKMAVEGYSFIQGALSFGEDILYPQINSAALPIDVR